MREIKFRYWNDKKLIYFDLEYLLYNYQNAFSNIDSGCLDEPQQFTGLVDKNGRDIYEGDIVSYKGDTTDVKYNGSGFEARVYWSPGEDLSGGSWNCLINNSCEIIGNIFENKDLIN